MGRPKISPADKVLLKAAIDLASMLRRAEAAEAKNVNLKEQVAELERKRDMAEIVIANAALAHAASEPCAEFVYDSPFDHYGGPCWHVPGCSIVIPTITTGDTEPQEFSE